MGPAVVLGPSSILHFLHQVTPLRVVNQRREASLHDNARHSAVKLKGWLCKVPISICTLDLPLKSRKIYTLPAQSVYTAAVGGDITLDEPIAKTEEGNTEEPLELEEAPSQGETVATDVSESVQQPKQKSTFRRARTITVKNDDLVPGAVFSGKVTAIQPFGAFVDFGAFTNGLIHISRLRNSFVRAVEDVVEIGQEVSVQVLEVNLDASRISLMLREKNDAEQAANGELGDGGKESNEQKGRQARREGLKRTTKLQKGQSVTGLIKNKVRSGVFVSLPDGDEGFLPSSEMNVVQTHLQPGQEISVRVLQIERGRIGLTMKQEIDMKALNKSINKDSAEGAINPFKLAFQQNELIASYLEEKDRLEKVATQPATEVIGKEEVDENPLVDKLTTEKEILCKEDAAASATMQVLEENEPGGEEVDNKLEMEESGIGESAGAKSYGDKEATVGEPGKQQQDVLSLGHVHLVTQQETPQAHAAAAAAAAELSSLSSSFATDSQDVAEDDVPEDASSTQGSLQSTSSEVVADKIVSPVDMVAETDSIQSISLESAATETFDPAEKIAAKDVVISSEKTDTVEAQVESCSDVQVIPSSAEQEAIRDENQADVHTEIPVLQEGEPDVPPKTEVGQEIEAVANVPPKIEVGQEIEGVATVTSRVSNEVLEIPAVASDEAAPLPTMQQVEQTVPPSSFANVSKVLDNTDEKQPTVIISASLVKQLREDTGAGLMDCKKALTEAAGDLEKAREFLRKKGLASAEKKASRIASEGIIGSYIHDNRIGVLIEVNCETDFVARSDIFKSLVEDLAMQLVACPQVQFVSVEDVSPDVLKREREIEMQRDDLLKKPEQIREKIVDGRLAKRVGELTLLEQPYIRDDKILVKDHVKQVIATLGENIRVRRFLRYNLGEGLEKRSQDFAAEVAAQTKVKQPAL